MFVPQHLNNNHRSFFTESESESRMDSGGNCLKVLEAAFSKCALTLHHSKMSDEVNNEDDLVTMNQEVLWGGPGMQNPPKVVQGRRTGEPKTGSWTPTVFPSGLIPQKSFQSPNSRRISFWLQQKGVRTHGAPHCCVAADQSECPC